MPVLLCILDGWGCSTGGKYDAIHQAHTPYWTHLLKSYPSCNIATSGDAVGLPHNQMGNSEIGHMTIGSGRTIEHSLIRLNKELPHITNNQNFKNFLNKIKGHKCHLMGLTSPGGVHSHIDHINTLLKALTDNNIPVELHAFLDGRDTPPQSALQYTEKMNPSTICGRYYSMDRDKNWDRTQKSYETIMLANSKRVQSAQRAIEHYYSQGITDEFIPPTTIGDYDGIKRGDGILMANFRPDRVSQILTAFNGQADFSHDIPLHILGTIKYSEKLQIQSILPSIKINNTLGEVLEKNNMKQLRIAETEKYAHVTFFFNGGKEGQYRNEERILVASPKVKTYDLKPEMSAFEITNLLIPTINNNDFDLIVLNYANPDMVGHTGNMQATIKAVEAIDQCLKKLIPVALNNNIDTIITADHGNVELMYDEVSKSPYTAHTTGEVPLILVSNKNDITLTNGTLSDIAPTILKLLKIKPPHEMSGNVILQ